MTTTAQPTTATTTTTAALLDSLATAIEAKDATAVAAHYAPGATLSLLDRDHPPADPTTFAGTDEIEEYFRDICGRNLDHRVADRVASPDRIAFTQHCRYPSGQRVLCIAVATVRDGLIVDQTGVQVWDA
jgi:ketosteroid isomerase-like protein